MIKPASKAPRKPAALAQQEADFTAEGAPVPDALPAAGTHMASKATVARPAPSAVPRVALPLRPRRAR
jgi:hypothetical protein